MNVAVRLAAVAVLVLASTVASSARARVERFAVIVGRNQGRSDEVALRFAEADARRVFDVLRELGGFQPVNMVLLQGSSADEVRSTLITVNDRVRSAMALPDTQVMLFVYYSGHADAEALHLGASRLEVAELSRLVRGSPASFRLLVLDACQSGAATRKKGGTIKAPFAIPDDAGLPGEGLALLTASAEQEDAQESDELGASFFTHALVSGLLGAADRDHDGSVVLEEAYRHAYDATLRTTSRTASGTQHPSFSYDFRGQGRLVLTRPGLHDAARGTLALPPGADYLVLRADAGGAVLAEVGAGEPARRLSLPAGRYFVRGRAAEYLLEGTVELPAGADLRVEPAGLRRVEYAELVRKGHGASRRAHGLEAGGGLRTTLPNAETACPGGFLGYRLDLPRVALGARAGFCASRLDNVLLDARTDEYDLGVRAGHAFDLGHHLALEAGLGLSLVGFIQHFDTRGEAPPRRSLAGAAEAYAGFSADMPRGVYLMLEAAAQLYVLELLDEDGSGSTLRAAYAGRLGLGLGKRL